MFSPKRLLRAALLTLFFTLALLTRAEDAFQKALGSPEEMTISADDVGHDVTTGMARAKGNVRIIYGKLTLTANEASINRESMDFTAVGNVIITLADNGGTWRAPAIKGNLQSRAFTFGPYRLDSPVWHSAGDKGDNDKDGNATLTHAWLSTCDLENPHYRLSASSVTYRNDKTFTARNVLFKLGPVPIFYFPILWGNTDGNSGFILRPGYSGKKGAYLRIGRTWKNGDEITTRVYTDLMSKRGVGLGIENSIDSDIRKVESLAYGLLDSDSPETEHGYNRRFRSTDERFRLQTSYCEQLAETIMLRANVDLLSDIDFLEDWFKRDFRQLGQPKSFLDLAYEGDTISAGILVRPRLNDFYTVAETLPELRLDVPRLNIDGLPIQYESHSKLGYYSMKWRNFDRKRNELIPDELYDDQLYDDPDNYQTWRAHTQHFLYLPIHIGDAAVFTPRAGAALTYYSRSSKQKVTRDNLADIFDADNPDDPFSVAPVVNYDAHGGEVTRAAFEFGAELKTRAFSDWANWESEYLDIHGVRHVIEPYANYTFSPDPSHNRDYLYYFDDIDRLQQQHFIRLGIDQRLITKRNYSRKPFIRLQSYVDFHFDRDSDTNKHPADLGNRIDFYPRDYLNVWTALVHDIGAGDIQRAESGFRFGHEDKLNLSLRYIYRNEHISRSTYSLGTSLVDFTGESGYLKKRFESADVFVADLFIPINPLTSIQISAEYDFEQNKLSEHKYFLKRQLHCWIMGLGFGWDNDEFEALIMFQLTAFPKIKLDLNM